MWLVVCGGGKAVGLLIWDQYQLCSDVYSCEELSTFKRRTAEMVHCEWMLGTTLWAFTNSILEKDREEMWTEQKWVKCKKKKRQRRKVWAMMEGKVLWKDWSSLLGFNLMYRSELLIQHWRKKKQRSQQKSA